MNFVRSHGIKASQLGIRRTKAERRGRMTWSDKGTDGFPPISMVGHGSKSLDISVSQRRITGIPGFIFIRSIFILRGSIPPLPSTLYTHAHASTLREILAFKLRVFHPVLSAPLLHRHEPPLALPFEKEREREGTPCSEYRATFSFFFFFLRLRIRLPWKSNAASSLAASFFFSDYFLPFVISSLSFRRPFLSLSLARSLAFPSSVLIFASKSELQSPTKCGNC